MKPKIEQGIGSYTFSWNQREDTLIMRLSRIRERSGGQPTCYMVTSVKQGEQVRHIYGADFNLSSEQVRARRAKTLAARYEGPDWDMILEQLCLEMMEHLHQGQPIEVLRSNNPDLKPPSFLVKPLLYGHLPNVLFGEGGALKGYLALCLALSAQLPWTDNPLGFTPARQSTKVLYLDWESDRDETEYRWSQMIKGMGLPDQELAYRRCFRSLQDDIEEIHTKASEIGAGLIIVDSLAPACGAVDIFKSDPAIQLFNLLRELNLTSLIIAHTSKDKEKGKTIYGSVFFGNLSRSVWEIQKQQEPGSSVAEVALFHRKVNPGGHLPPMGLKYNFFEEGVVIERIDVASVPGFSEKLPVRIQIEHLLRMGALTTKEISDELQIPQNTVRVTLNRFRQKFTHVGDKWGLLARQGHEVPEAFR